MSLSVMLMLRSGFLVEQLLDAQIAAELGLQILDRHLALVELLLEFFLRVGRFQLGELRVHVGIRGHQAPLLGALQHDFVVDQRAQDLQALDGHLIVAGMLGLPELGILILLVELGKGDRPAVHGGGHAGGRGAVTCSGHQQQKEWKKDATHGQEVSF